MLTVRARPAPRACALGFTLIELMTVVAIVALVMLLGYPSYEAHVLRTQRTEGRSELLRLAAAQERYFTNCNAFATSFDGAQSECKGLGYPESTVTTEGGHYEISLDGDGSGFTLTATPQGRQAKDTDCGNLTLSDTGAKGASGSKGAEGCW